MNVEDDPVVVEQQFSCSTDELWNAITAVDEMRAWYFAEIPEFKPLLDFNVQFSIESGGREFVHMWTITEVCPLSVISYRWQYKGLPGVSLVTFAVSDGGGSSKLKVSTEILEDFPDDIPEFTRESCLGGWNFLIKESLKNYLE